MMQNVVTLLNIARYELAFQRTVGLPYDLVDRPSSKLAQEYQAALVELIEDNEPRASVESLQYLGVSEHGQINFEVVMEIVF